MSDQDDAFAREGFTSEAIRENIPDIRQECREWFEFADDVNVALQKIACKILVTVRGGSTEPRTVAARLVLRSCQNLQGAIIVAERGMVSEAKTLARCILENAFCLGALAKDAPLFMSKLEADYLSSRKRDGQFVYDQTLEDMRPEDRAEFDAWLANYGKVAPMNFKDVAAISATYRFYRIYIKLSQEAAHPSATSLHRHVQSTLARDGWHYRWGPGTNEEIGSALRHASMFACIAAVCWCEFSEDREQVLPFVGLRDRMNSMPEPDGSVEKATVAKSLF